MVTRKKTAAASSTVVSEDNTFQNFITELAALCAKYDTTVPAAVDKTPAAEADEEPAEKPARGRARRGAGKTTAAKPEADEDEPEDEEDEDEAEEAGPTRAELEKKTVVALRKMLNALKTYDPADVKDADKETLIAALLGEDADDEDEDAEEPEDDEADEADEEDRRAEYEEMTLAQLRKLARDEFDADPSELKPMKKDELIDFLLEPEEDGEAEDELDEEEDGYSEEELDAMDVAALEEIADEWELEVDKPGRMTAKAKATYKADLIEAIVEAQDEEEEE